MRLEPVTHGIVHSRLPAAPGRFQLRKNIRIKADSGWNFGWGFLHSTPTSSKFFAQLRQRTADYGVFSVRFFLMGGWAILARCVGN